MARARRVLMRRDPVLAPIIKKYGSCGISDRPRDRIFSAGSSRPSSPSSCPRGPRRRSTGGLRALVPDSGPPTPDALLPLSDEALRGVGLSRQKTGYMRDLAQNVLDGIGENGSIVSDDDEEVIAELTKIKGIGRWTVEMLLIFRFARPDVLPVGDLGIVKAIQKAYRLRKTPDSRRMQKIAESLASVSLGRIVVSVGQPGEQAQQRLKKVKSEK